MHKCRHCGLISSVGNECNNCWELRSRLTYLPYKVFWSIYKEAKPVNFYVSLIKRTSKVERTVNK